MGASACLLSILGVNVLFFSSKSALVLETIEQKNFSLANLWGNLSEAFELIVGKSEICVFLLGSIWLYSKCIAENARNSI